MKRFNPDIPNTIHQTNTSYGFVPRDNGENSKKLNLVGVQKQQKGKCGAQIKAPFKKQDNFWRGVFATLNEASKTHMTKKLKFEERLRAERGRGVYATPDEAAKTYMNKKREFEERLRAEGWRGVYATPDEAAKTYMNKKREFEERLRAEGGRGVYPRLYRSSELPRNLDALKVMLDVNTSSISKERWGFLNGEQVLDNYGRFVGRFSKIDDSLKIHCTSDGGIIPPSDVNV